MLDITKSKVLALLKNLDTKDVNKDLLILNSVKTLEVKDNNVKITLVLSLNEGASIDVLKNLILTDLKKQFSEVKNFDLDITTKTHTQTVKKPESILPGVKYTIAVSSGKGGVGKSTVAVNLAVALAKTGAKVGLIDADIYGPSIPLMLGVNEKPKVYQMDGVNKMLPIENYGIKMMSIGFLIDEDNPVIWRGPMASQAVKQFMSDVHWEELDFLLFDMPPGTGDIQLTLVQTIPLSAAVIVTTPQEVSLIDARKGLRMFSKVDVPVAGIIENMSYFIAPDTGKQYDIFGKDGGKKMAEEYSVPFLGGIPIDPRIRLGGDKGMPIMYDMPDSEHAATLLNIANELKLQMENLSDQSGSEIEISL